MREKKGYIFEGFLSGKSYDRFTDLFGLGPKLYCRAAMALPLRPGMHVLELGCGTALFGLAIAERIGPTSRIHGIDLSQNQITYAKRKTSQSNTTFAFHRCSMDEVPFEDATFDMVVSSMAFHEVPSDVRRGAIREAARVLKPAGLFALMDWSKPRFGLMTILWLPFVYFVEYSEDNWNNTYPALCREQSLALLTDVYLTSLIRCQLFRKD